MYVMIDKTGSHAVANRAMKLQTTKNNFPSFFTRTTSYFPFRSCL